MKWIVGFFSLWAVLSACKSESGYKRVLPIIGNYDLDYKTIDGKEVIDTIWPQVPNFRFLNEDSVWVQKSDFKGKVLVAEFFFASCPTICPIMNKQMKRFMDENKDLHPYLQVLSFTINPDDDTPSVLRAYKEKYGITSYKNWSFLTGKSEEEVNQMGIENFQIFSGKDDESAGGYAHSGAFTLVDKEGYVRGVYAITNYDTSTNEEEYQRLNKEIRKLLKEEYEHTLTK